MSSILYEKTKIIKQQFTIEDIIDNYYSNVEAFANNLF